MSSVRHDVSLSEEQVQMIARALADPRRYAILKRLGECGGLTPCAQMRDEVDISAATLSHHMKELEAAGLVDAQRDGKFVFYKPQPEVLTAFFERLKSDLI